MAEPAAARDAYALTPTEAAAWEEAGYFVRTGAQGFSEAEVFDLRRATDDVVSALAHPSGKEYHLDGRRFVDTRDATLQFEYAEGASGLRVVEPVYHLHPALDALVDDDRLVAPMRALVGATELGLWTAKMNLKGPGSAAFGWHQDSPYWYHDSSHVDRLPNVMLALDTQSEETGCFRVIAGSHRHGLLPGTDDGSQLGGLYTDPSSFQIQDATALEVAAGALIFFSPHLVHGSGDNRSRRDRRALIYTYQPAGHAALKNGEVRNVGNRDA